MLGETNRWHELISVGDLPKPFETLSAEPVWRARNSWCPPMPIVPLGVRRKGLQLSCWFWWQAVCACFVRSAPGYLSVFVAHGMGHTKAHLLLVFPRNKAQSISDTQEALIKCRLPTYQLD